MAACLSLAVLLLVLATLLSLGLAGGGGAGQAGHLVSFDMHAASADRAKAAKAIAPKQKAARKAAPPTQTPPQPVPTQAPVQMIHLSREEFAASDIAAIANRRNQQASAEAAAQSNGAFGPGGGPNGVRLYPAQWFREPTDAEMSPFLAHGAPEGAWATIACKTIEHYHVENCQDLDEYPLGSGLARGLRRASWQFLVWPPRVDGKPQIGTWVRIRFDFTKSR